MSLKRKYEFDQVQTTSIESPENDSITAKYIKTDEFFDDDRKMKCFFIFWEIKIQFRIDESNDRPSSPSLSSDEIKTFPTKHRRKSLAQSKRLPSANRSPTIPMILSLIDSLVDEKELQQNNDENLLLTIDNLIDNLKHLREKIQTVHHDDTHPLNLTKPKSKQHTNEQNKSSSTSSSSSSSAAQAAAATVSPATTNNFQLPSALFSSQQPFFSPFAGRNSSQSKKEFFLFFFLFHTVFSSEYDTFTKLFQIIRCICTQWFDCRRKQISFGCQNEN